MFRNRPVSLALVGLFLWVTGCTSYRQIEPSEVADYGEVRVTFTDGERLVSDSVAVAGDSIHYWKRAEPGSTYSKVWASYPLDQVSVVEARKHDRTKTVLCVLGVVAVMVAVTALAVSSDSFLMGN